MSCLRLLLRPARLAARGRQRRGGASGGQEVGKRARAGPSGDTPETKARCAAWSVDDVVRYLEGLSLGHVGHKFIENGVDGRFLMELSGVGPENELGFKTLQARKVLSRMS